MLQLVYLGNGEMLRYEPDEADLLATERKVEAIWRAIQVRQETGDWQPRPAGAVRWCSYQALCPAFGGTPPPLPVRPTLSAVGPSGGGRPPAVRVEHAGDLDAAGAAQRRVHRRRAKLHPTPAPSASSASTPLQSGSSGSSSRIRSSRARDLVGRPEPTVTSVLGGVEARRGRRPGRAPRRSRRLAPGPVLLEQRPQVARLPAALRDRLRAARVERAPERRLGCVRDLAARAGPAAPSGSGRARGSP